MIPPKVNFAALDKKEWEFRLKALINKNTSMRLWKKGSKDKFDFVPESLNLIDSCLIFEKMARDLINEKILFNFEQSGQNFFGEGRVVVENEQIILKNIEKIYKSERRKNFRLLCYPMFDIIARFEIEDNYEGDNVVSFNSKENYDQIKKDFLAFHYNIENKDVGTIARVRVHDISATGIGIYIGELEKPYFENDKVFKNIKVGFFDDILNIDEAKIVYSMAPQNELEGTYKVGINFEEISEKDEHTIVRKINQVLKEYDFDKDFEDFI